MGVFNGGAPGNLPLIAGAALLSFGGGTTTVGVVKALAQRGISGFKVPAGNAETDEYVATLSQAIKESSTANTVEGIAGKLGWSEQDVARALGWLQARGELREELDTTSGEFYYVSVKVPRDLATRLSSI